MSNKATLGLCLAIACAFALGCDATDVDRASDDGALYQDKLAWQAIDPAASDTPALTPEETLEAAQVTLQELENRLETECPMAAEQATEQEAACAEAVAESMGLESIDDGGIGQDNYVPIPVGCYFPDYCTMCCGPLTCTVCCDSGWCGTGSNT